jgi:hypothetical protein
MTVDNSSHLLATKLKDLMMIPSKRKNKILKWKEDIELELMELKLNIKFNFSISDDWYCLEDTNSIFFPFYLLTDELLLLEEKYAGSVEGKFEIEFKKLLRHEIGHVFDHYIKKDKFLKKIRERHFGDYDNCYPEFYIPKYELRKRHLDYLGDCYYQSHTDELFAEVFAQSLENKFCVFFNCRYFNTMKDLVTLFKKNKKKKRFFKVSSDQSHNKLLVHYYQNKRKLNNCYAHRDKGSINHKIVNSFFNIALNQKNVIDSICFNLGLHKNTILYLLKPEFVDYETIRLIANCNLRSKGEIRDILVLYLLNCLQQGKHKLYL